MFAKSVKTTVFACAAALLLAGFSQTGCDCGSDNSEFGGGGQEDSGAESGTKPPPLGGSDGGKDGSAGQCATSITVTPSTQAISVTIVNGVITVNKPVTFSALVAGKPGSNIAWTVDRGELGAVDAKGVFTASGKAVGDGTVFATVGNCQASAKVTVTIADKQNGNTGGDAGVGAGGVGGVGGELLGGAVDPGIVTRLENEPPTADPSFKYLYPYANTVFPRGVLAPLVMWDTTNTATAILVSISQKNFTFEGTYDVTGRPGDQTRRVHIDDAAWTAAINGNAGDPLTLTVKVYSAGTDKVYGPITETLKVAPGILKGTVYYNSYDSHLTGSAPGVNRPLGGVIAIQPRSPNPQLAVANMVGKCHVCHSLSSDGSTLFAADGERDFANPTPDGSGDYRNGASYDLKNGGARSELQTVTTDGGVVNAGNDRKFVWAAPYPDGSFLLTSYGYARETYLGDLAMGGPSALVSKINGAAVTSNFNTAVTSAVTPAFSPDGKKLVFNFWTGPGANGVTQGDGHSLAIFDFACGAPMGSVTCGAGAKTFSNLREIYHPALTADGGPFLGWPSFTPDGAGVVFHQTTQLPPNMNPPTAPTAANQLGRFNDQLTSWFSRDAELYFARDDGKKVGVRLNALNGRDAGGLSYLPTNAVHPDDTLLNYMPTVNPVPSGGFFWVVFESRRRYGNLLVGDPWATPGTNCPAPDQAQANCPYGSKQKKLWVAAIDIATGAVDPSHPAFYLPGQELDAGNSRGFWVVDPCKSDGQSCETGDECCNGFCRNAGPGGALICQKPTTPTCSQEFEKCTTDADCCTFPTDVCIANRCAKKVIAVQ
jgi:hypothetical protein